MRKSEIQVGGEYALIEYEGSTPRRVRVEAFNQSRHVYSGSRDFRGHTTKDGVLVTFLDPATGAEKTMTKRNVEKLTGWAVVENQATEKVTTVEVPMTDVTITRKLVRTWEAQLKVDLSYSQRKREAEAQRAKRDAQLNSLRDILKSHGLITADYDVQFRYDRDARRVLTSKVEIPTDLLQALVNIAGLEVK